MNKISVYLFVLATFVLTVNAYHHRNNPIKNQKKISDLPLIDDLAILNDHNDEKSFVKLSNVFMKTYNAVKENRIDHGQIKLLNSFLNKLGKKLLEYIWNRESYIQSNKALLYDIFESLEGSEKTKTKQIPFKWGR